MSNTLPNLFDSEVYVKREFDRLKSEGKFPEKIVEPIDTRLLGGFKEWVAWLPFGALSPGTRFPHRGYDFAAYLTKNGVCRFSLPKELPVRAIADGKVLFTVEKGYASSIYIDHTIRNSENLKKRRKYEGLVCNYGHVETCIDEGDYIKQGQVIGHLYGDDDSELFSRLVHLHFDIEIINSNMSLNTSCLFPNLEKNNVDSRGNPYFKLIKSDAEILPSKRRIFANTINGRCPKRNRLVYW